MGPDQKRTTPKSGALGSTRAPWLSESKRAASRPPLYHNEFESYPACAMVSAPWPQT